MSSFKIMSPMSVTEGRIVSTNVPESPEDEWASGTTYAKGARVKVTSVHKVYESQVAGNVGKSPLDPANAAMWLDAGATNRYKVFDNSVSTQTANPDLIEYRLRMNIGITSIGVLNVTGATKLTMRVVDPIYGEVKKVEVNFAPTQASSTWFDWFFGQRVAKTQVVMLELPTYPNADIYLTMEGGAQLAIGTIIVGQVREFGIGTNYGATVGIQDYSVKGKNSFGDTILLERPFAKRGTFEVHVPKGQVDDMFTFLSSVRAKICLYIATDEYECTTILGFYRDFQLAINYHDYSDYSLEIEGMT